jgi:hypothetical protein
MSNGFHAHKVHGLADQAKDGHEPHLTAARLPWLGYRARCPQPGRSGPGPPAEAQQIMDP